MSRTANKLRYLKRQFRAGKLKRGGKRVTSGREVTKMALRKGRR